MHTLIGFTVVVLLDFLCDGAALAQGTKDPSNPATSLVYPIRPRHDVPTARTIRPNTVTALPPIRLRRIRPAR